MKQPIFEGTGTAIVTPFKNDGSIDFNAFRKMINHQLKGGVEFIVALGTTGESVTLSEDEKWAVVNFVLEEVEGRLPVVMGVGGNNTAAVEKVFKKICDDNIAVDGILSVTPYYNKPSQEGIYQHFKQIAMACPLPVILYNVPGRTSVNMLPGTTLRLAHEFDNIVAVKEASGNLNQVNYILRDKPRDFKVLSGDDQLTLAMIAMGGSGVISVTSNAFPFEFSEMVRKALDKRLSKAQKIQNELLEFMDQLFVEGNPSGIKAALNILGLIENQLRLPLVPVSDITYLKLSELIEKIRKVNPAG
jgi:4-hydroxy-tetrahydrodipicolinate synthase